MRQGAQRLDGILAAMSEATELEQAIRETAAQPFDLAAVVASCCAAYRDVYPEREIAYRCDVRAGDDRRLGRARRAAARQARRQRRELQRARAAASTSRSPQPANELVLSVANRGPPLPAKMRGRLFDSLVSIREQRDGRPHLGLGLHIVALVADFHGGRCEADDLPDGSGVVFRVSLPPRRGGCLGRRAAELSFGAGSWLTPVRNSSTARAAPRPSLMAQTTSDWPRRQSPAANTPGTLVANLPCAAR